VALVEEPQLMVELAAQIGSVPAAALWIEAATESAAARPVNRVRGDMPGGIGMGRGENEQVNEASDPSDSSQRAVRICSNLIKEIYKKLAAGATKRSRRYIDGDWDRRCADDSSLNL
jgi:hypothetical protein